MSGVGQEHPRQGYSAAERVGVSRFLSFVELVRVCRQLDGPDVLVALRQRQLPMPLRARARDLLAALQHVFGQLLIKRAQERLFELHPAFSAKSGLSRWQKMFLAGCTAFTSLAFIAAPNIASSVTMLVLAVLFLTGTGVKLGQ